ncbi:hypothetical protein [Actinomadura sp. B10D3]|uniref:hypothetical protein n=1 Tax=Actinomadura sp. B10D3 TaxID=3153557 RepID=UPI00325CFF95
MRTFFGISFIVCAVGGLLLTFAFGWYVFLDDAQVRNPAYEATMWRNEPADELFPDKLNGSVESGEGGNPSNAKWVRAGISQDTSCEKGLDGDALKAATRYGCEAVLRATYVEATGSHVATIALIVVKDHTEDGDGFTPANRLGDRIQDKGDDIDQPDFGVRAFTVPGTPAAKWTDEARNGTYATTASEYAVAATAGATDGRRAGRLPAPWNGTSDVSAGRGDRATFTYGAEALTKSYADWLGRLSEGEAS